MVFCLSCTSKAEAKGVSITKKAENLYKKICKTSKSVNISGKNASAIVKAFNKKYLSYTNYSCVMRKVGSRYYLYPKETMVKLISQNNKLKLIKKEKLFVSDYLNSIIKSSGALKTKSQKKQLKLVEKFFIETFSYDNAYKTGMRTKWSRYQDSHGANVWYLFKYKKGICSDFTEAYKLVCKKLGIKCKIEYGGTTDDYTKTHAWNIVVLNDDTVLYKDISEDVVSGKLYWCQQASVNKFLDYHRVLLTY